MHKCTRWGDIVSAIVKADIVVWKSRSIISESAADFSHNTIIYRACSACSGGAVGSVAVRAAWLR